MSSEQFKTEFEAKLTRAREIAAKSPELAPLWLGRRLHLLVSSDGVRVFGELSPEALGPVFDAGDN